MIASRSTKVVAQALLSAIWIGAGAGSAMAQSYSVNGQVGYLGEWEMKASLARTTTASGVNYDGPVMLRHVGLCSVNGPEEKSGVVRLTVSRKTSAVEGTLALKDLSPEERLVTNAEVDAALAERLGTVDYGDVLAAEGVATVALDDEGRLVRHDADGTTTLLD